MLDRESTPGMRVRRRLHPERAIDLGKNDLPHIRSRRLQRTLAQLLRQVRLKAMHDLEDLFHTSQILRDQHCQTARTRNRLQKTSRGHPGRQAHLPRLENDVVSPRSSFELLLYSVRAQRRDLPAARPHLEKFLSKHLYESAAVRGPLEILAKPLQPCDLICKPQCRNPFAGNRRHKVFATCYMLPALNSPQPRTN